MPISHPGSPYQALPLTDYFSPPFVGFDPYSQTLGSLGSFGPLLSMFASWYGPSLLSKYGLVALGGGRGNVYRSLNDMRLHEMQLKIMEQTMQEQLQAYREAITGTARLAGIDTSSEDIANSIDKLVQLLSGTTPLLVRLAPDQLDALSGLRGSQAVMADRMFSASRFRADPVTGRLGLSRESIQATYEGVSRELLSGGRAQDRLLTAGQLGSLFDQLQRRAMLPAITLENLSPDILRRGAQRLGLDLSSLPQTAGPEQIVEHVRTLQPQMLSRLRLELAQELREADVQQISQNLRTYEGAIQAIRELFGDAGHPNAPVPQLFQALQQLTGFQAGQIEPVRLEQLLRTSYALSRAAGLSAQGALLHQMTTAAMATQLGLPGTIGLQAAQGSLAMRAAMVQTGALSGRVWGLGDIDQQTYLDQQARLNAAQSRFANQLSALMRIADTMPEALQPNSQAWRLVQQIRRGEAPAFMTEIEFQTMLQTDTNLSGAQIQTLMAQTQANRRYLEQYNLAGLTRERAQGEELAQHLGRLLRLPFQEQLEIIAPDLDSETRSRLAIAASSGLVEAWRNLTGQQLGDVPRRNQILGQAILRSLQQAGPEGQRLLQQLGGPEQQQNWALRQAELSYGEIANYAQTLGQTPENLQQQHQPRNLRAAQLRRLQAELEARMESALAPISRGSLLERAMQAIMDYQPGDRGGLLKVFFQTIGSVPSETLQQQLEEPVQEIRDRMKFIQQLQEEIPEAAAEQQTELLEKYRQETEELRAQLSKLSYFAERHRLLINSPISSRQVNQLFRQQVEWDRRLTTQTSSTELDQQYLLERKSTDELLNRILRQREFLGWVGPTAVQISQKTTEEREALEGLADRYASGSLADLLRGRLSDQDLSETEREEIAVRAKTLRQNLNVHIGELQRMLEEPKPFDWLSKPVRDLAERAATFIYNQQGPLAVGATIGDLLQLSEQDFETVLSDMRRLGLKMTDEEAQSLREAHQQVQALYESAQDALHERQDRGTVTLQQLWSKFLGVDDLSRQQRDTVLKTPDAHKLVELLNREPGTVGFLQSLSQDVQQVQKALQEQAGLTVEQLVSGQAGPVEAQLAAQRLKRQSGGLEMLELAQNVHEGNLDLSIASTELKRILSESVGGDFSKLSDKAEREYTIRAEIGRLTVSSDGSGKLETTGKGLPPGAAR